MAAVSTTSLLTLKFGMGSIEEAIISYHQFPFSLSSSSWADLAAMTKGKCTCICGSAGSATNKTFAPQKQETF